MDLSPEERAQGARVTAAVQGAFSDSGQLATKFTLVAETIDADGHRGVWVLNSEGLTEWDRLGLVAYADTLTDAEND